MELIQPNCCVCLHQTASIASQAILVTFNAVRAGGAVIIGEKVVIHVIN